MRSSYDLPALLAELDPHAELAERHLWLIHVLHWMRSAAPSIEVAMAKAESFVAAFEADEALRLRLQLWWQRFSDTVDITTLLADFGFAPRTAMVTELTERLRLKLLPGTPETIDAAELFSIALPHEFDARWLTALPEPLLQRLTALLVPEEAQQGIGFWRHALLGAITILRRTNFGQWLFPELRLRMSEEAREEQPFHALIHDVESFRIEFVARRAHARTTGAGRAAPARTPGCLPRGHWHGVPTLCRRGDFGGLVFRVRQVRTRIVRVRQLLACLTSAHPEQRGGAAAGRFCQRGRATGAACATCWPPTRPCWPPR